MHIPEDSCFSDSSGLLTLLNSDLSQQGLFFKFKSVFIGFHRTFDGSAEDRFWCGPCSSIVTIAVTTCVRSV